MWIEQGPRGIATALEVLDRMNRAAKGEHVDEELDEDGLPMVMSG